MQSHEHQFKFTGNGSDYFVIWIVNIILTVLTLGIYSAWAKVRRMQYFYRNTRLDDSSFDYHGTAIAILKGRLIAIALFGSYSVLLQIMPLVGLAIGLCIALLMPFLLVLSFRFRLYNSSYRGLRFGFTGSIKSAYMVYLVLPIATTLTVLLLAPFAHQRSKAYQQGNSHFGQTAFSFDANVGSFYKIYFFTLMLFVLVLGFFSAGIYGLFQDNLHNLSGEMIVGVVVAVYLLLIFTTLFILPYFMARLQNLVWNHTSLGEHRFSSTMSARGLAWVIFSNFLLIILTTGLFKPFADIRMAKYRVEHMAFIPDGNMEDIIASAQQKISATGTETAEIFDVDIGF